MINGLISILLVDVIVVLLLSMAFVLWRYTERNKLQKTLMRIILLWSAMFIGLGIDMICIYDGKNIPVSGVMNFHYIWLALTGLFSLMCYPAVVLYQRNLNLRDSFLWLLPLLITLVIYIVWHLINGVSMNYCYTTYAELWDNLYTVPVVLRLIMVFFFILYLVLVLANIWRLIPIYEKYCNDNYSDAARNVNWLRLVVAAIGSVCFAFLIVLFWERAIIHLIYASITGLFFVFLTINAVSHKLFSEEDNIELRWTFKVGWQILGREMHVIESVDYTSKVRFEEWMRTYKPFTDSEFAARHVYEAFPELRYPALTNILASSGFTFQSYVRSMRIEHACRMIENNPRMVSKELAFEVGFSSSQAFSRAFVGVKGITPMEYRKKQSQSPSMRSN